LRLGHSSLERDLHAAKSLSSLGFDRPHKQTRRERFLAEMEIVVPWAALSALIEPLNPSGERGRPPLGIERMLRIYFLQQWFNMSDPQAHDSLNDSAVMRNFVGIDLGNEAAPDETTICKFRHLIENNGFSKMMLKTVNDHLKSKGIKIGTGMIMDATRAGRGETRHRNTAAASQPPSSNFDMSPYVRFPQKTSVVTKGSANRA
jgi:IS5 family transposase